MPDKQSRELIATLESEGWEVAGRASGDTVILQHPATGEAMYVHGTLSRGKHSVGNTLARARRKVRFADSVTHRYTEFLRRKYEVAPTDYRDVHLYLDALAAEFLPNATAMERRKANATLGVAAHEGRNGMVLLRKGQGGPSGSIRPGLYRIYGPIAWEREQARQEAGDKRAEKQRVAAAAAPTPLPTREPEPEPEPVAQANGEAAVTEQRMRELVREVMHVEASIMTENDELRTQLGLAADELSRTLSYLEDQRARLQQILDLLRGEVASGAAREEAATT